MSIEHSAPFLVSSDPANGALNVSPNGGAFTVRLSNPINIPRNAVSCSLECNTANVVFTTPNVSVALENNNIEITYGVITANIIFPDGLYNLTDITNELSRQYISLGWPEDLIIWSANEATQKIILTFPYDGTQVNFLLPESIGPLLGFEGFAYPTLPSDTSIYNLYIVTAPNKAAFNTITSFFITCDLSETGVPLNDRGGQIIAEVPITAERGSLIAYQPINPIRINTSNLIGYSRGSFKISLTDQNLNEVDAFGEKFNALLVLRYTVPI